MSEQLQLVITVDDQGSAVVQKFSGAMHQVIDKDLASAEKNAGAAAAGFGKLTQSLDQATAKGQAMSTGLGKVTSGLGETEKTAGKAASGMDKITQGVSQVTSKLPAFTSGLTATRQAVSQLDKPIIGIEKIGQTVTIAANALPPFQQKVFTTADALKQLEKQSSTTAIGFTQLEKSVAQTGSKGLSPALTKGLQELEAGLQKTQQAAGKTTKTFDGMSVPLGGLLKQGAAISAGMLGFQGVASVVTGTVSAMAGFEAKMNTVNTLVQGNVPLQQKLRAELLQLPPVLGSSTQLAEGLYAALSAGIEPGKAVAFVGEAAKTAKAGLTDMETSVNTLASVMQAYGIQAKDVTQVSDLLFQTVNVGKGKFEEFARGFAVVSPLAKTLGISLKEVSATLGTLSFAFPSAAEGATGMRSMMTNLIQKMADFRDIGIDVQKVIAEEGLTGVMKRLQKATGGNIEQIRELIPDVEGLSAALALMGPQAGAQAKNLREMEKAAGATQGAFKEMSKGLGSSWDELKNTMDRLAQEMGPPVLDALTAITKAATEVVKVSVDGIETVVGAAHKGMAELQQMETAGVLDWAGPVADAKGFVDVLSEIEKAIATLGGVTDAFDMGTLTADMDDFNNTVGKDLPFMLNEQTTPAVQQFNMEIARAKDIAAANEQALRESVGDMAGLYGELDTKVREANTRMVLQTVTIWEQGVQKIVQRWVRVPIEQGPINEAITAGQGNTVRAIALIWENGVAKIVEDHSAMPAAMQPAQEAVKEQAKSTAGAVVAAWQEAHARIMASYEGVLEAQLALNEATGQGIRQAAQQTTDSIGQASTRAQQAVREIESAFIPLLDRIAQFKGFSTPFANTEAEIVEQIRGFQENIAKLREPGLHQTIPGYVEFQIAEYNKAITELYKRLEALRLQNEQARQAAGQGTTQERESTSRLQSQGLAGSGGSPGGGGLTASPNPAPQFSYNPSSGSGAGVGTIGPSASGTTGTPNFSTNPIDFGFGGSLPGFARGGMVRGSGGPDSVVARVSPGERIFSPHDNDELMMLLREALGGRQEARGLPPISITISGATDPQGTVRVLLPALREAFRRGEFTR